MVNAIKNILATRAPGLAVALWEWRKRWFPNAVQAGERRMYAKLGEPKTVIGGPFKGMRYHRVAFGGSALDRALGVYEHELAPAIEWAIAWQPDVVIDIGTSDGYYAVGMATRLPRARVIGFDVLPICQYMTARLARRNAVESRVSARGKCEPSALASALGASQRIVVICDCEGYEEVLLDPGKVPQLARAAMIVEVHDLIVPEVSRHLEERFAGTHDIQRLYPEAVKVKDLPSEYAWSEQDLEAIPSGTRPAGNFFMVLKPKAHGAA